MTIYEAKVFKDITFQMSDQLLDYFYGVIPTAADWWLHVQSWTAALCSLEPPEILESSLFFLSSLPLDLRGERVCVCVCFVHDLYSDRRFC